MKGRITLDYILRAGEQLAEEVKGLALDQSQQSGFNYIDCSVKNGGLTIGVGPLGTGKTLVFTKVYENVLDHIDDDEALIHVAPTNKLLEDTAVKTAALLVAGGYDISELKDLMRVFGSRFMPEPLNQKVKLIFTTGYQPGALIRLSNIKRSVHLMIDEASRTPYHEAFMPLSNTLAKRINKGDAGFIGSFNVIGDPMQAIVEPLGVRWKYEHLIVYRMILKIIPQEQRKDAMRDPSLLFTLAKQYSSGSDIKFFFLDTTYRMPEPTETLVSIPFYGGKLRAYNKYHDAMNNILNEGYSLNTLVNETQFLSKIREKLDNALESMIPVVYIKDCGYAYSPKLGRSVAGLDEFDKFRSVVGTEIATYITLRTSVSHVLFVAPYNEIVQQARIYSLRRLTRYLHASNRSQALSFATIHSVLGSEGDIVIAVLGKEYVGKLHETIYFHTPELVNVQLSRHRRMLIIIGNVERLAKNMSKIKHYSYVSRIKESLEDLREKGLILEHKMREY